MRADVVALNLTEAMDVDLDLEPPEKKGQGRLEYSGRPLRPQLQNLIHFHFGFV